MSNLPIGTMMLGGSCPICGYSHPSMNCDEYKDSKRRQVNYLLKQLGHSLETAFSDIIVERLAQDAQWGGPKHDDGHHPADWQGFIGKQLNLCDGAHGVRGYRDALVKIAALAVAAIESFDRKYPDALNDDEIQEFKNV